MVREGKGGGGDGTDKVSFRDGARVDSIVNLSDGRYGIQLQPSWDATADTVDTNVDDNNNNKVPPPIEEFDAIIMAVGGTAMGKIATTSPAIQSIPSIPDFTQCRGITCVAVRMFLKPNRVITAGLGGGGSATLDRTELPPDMAQAMVDSPVVVVGPKIDISSGSGGFGTEYLEETGFCIYDLQRLHDEFAVVGSPSPDDDDDGRTAVLEVDFYRADAIADLTNDQIANLALEAVASALSTAKIDPTTTLLDVAVVRARNAVSHFCVDSASFSPDVRLSSPSANTASGGGGGIYMCGDWIDRTGHASWSTEKAVVTGRQASLALVEDFELGWGEENVAPTVIEVAEDTKPLEALRGVAGVLRDTVPMEGDGAITSPWIFSRQVLERLF